MNGARQLWARQRPTLLGLWAEPWHVIEGFARGDRTPMVRTACERQLVGRGARISDRPPGGRASAPVCPRCLLAISSVAMPTEFLLPGEQVVTG